MSKTQRSRPEMPDKPPKPKQLKRQRQREAMEPPTWEFPQREQPVTFKPMG